MIRALILGANGQLGRAFQEVCPDQTFLDRLQCDVTDPESVRKAIQAKKPDVVINCSAYTNVDGAEDNVDEAYAINRNGPLYLVNACHEAGSFLVHFSTDYVFDGKADNPIKETHIKSPLGVYGASKLAGDNYLCTIDKHLLVRTSWVLGRYRKNFLKSILSACQKGKSLSVVSDQRGGPTPATLLAQEVWEVLPGFLTGFYKPGTYHVTGTPGTWHEVAQVVAKEYSAVSGNAVEVSECATADWPTKAERPMYSVLSNQKWQDATRRGPIPWETEVRAIVRELMEEI